MLFRSERDRRGGVIAGRVVDAKTGEPVPRFNVKVRFTPQPEPGDAEPSLSSELIRHGAAFDATGGDFSLGGLVTGGVYMATGDFEKATKTAAGSAGVVLLTPPLLAKVMLSPTGRKWLTTGLKMPKTEQGARAASHLVTWLGKDLLKESGRKQEQRQSSPPPAMDPKAPFKVPTTQPGGPPEAPFRIR